MAGLLAIASNQHELGPGQVNGVQHSRVARAFKAQLALGPFHEEVIDLIRNRLRVAWLGIRGGGHERPECGEADGGVCRVLGRELQEASALRGFVAENQSAEEVGLGLARIGERSGFFECIDGLNATVLTG